MIPSTLLPKFLVRAFSALLLGLLTASSLLGQTTINHNIGTTSLVIQGSSTNNYLVTGTTSANRIIVGAGYNGTITLQNVTITSSGTATFTAACGNGTNTVTTGSCMAIMGKNRASAVAPAPNLAPVTRVNLVLEGNNQLTYTSNSEYCAIQVDEGAQIEIGAIDPNSNSSGVLVAKATTITPGSGSIAQSGAGIGAVGTSGYNGLQGYSVMTGGSGCGTQARTTGGNIIISSGTITAWGGHAAGIGGAHYDYYNGIIIVYGGIVNARANFDAAGIGSGCPLGTGVVACYADNSTIVALPPAQITAYGAGQNANGGVGTGQFPSLGLTGAKNITYINDPNKPVITVHTVDLEPNANIYLDLTETPGLVNIFSTLGIDYDLTKVRVGKTNASGVMTFNAQFEQNTTFFTDASSSKPATLGRPYKPVTKTVLVAETIVLPLLETEIAFTDYPSTPLEVGYTIAQANTNAHRIKVEYNDTNPMTSVSWALQGGSSTDFTGLQFYAADEITPISTPTTLSNGMTFYIAIPIKQGKPIGVYSDVVLISGIYKGVTTGYIRRVGWQRVVVNDSPTNTYIKVTASPNKFTAALPTTNTVTLTLKIDHTGMPVLYDPLDVVAKYLVTTIADYDAALVANPLNGGSWSSLNIPATNNTNTTTTVPFSGKLEGTYYIHWYVESGVAYAHSLAVTDPPRTYGGFGPYILKQAKVTLSLDKTIIDEGGGAATGTATLTAKLAGIDLAPTGGVIVNLTYSGTGIRTTDYTAPSSITIPMGQNNIAVSIVALADYIVEDNGAGNETIIITAPATVTVGGLTYDVIGSPLSIGIVDRTDGSISASWAQNAAEPNTNGRVTFKLPGSGSTAASCMRRVKIVYSLSGASATNNYTPASPTEAFIEIGNNSTTVDVLTPINNYVVEGSRQVDVTIESVTPL